MSELFKYITLEKYFVRTDKDYEFASIMWKWFNDFKAPHVYRDTHTVMVF